MQRGLPPARSATTRSYGSRARDPYERVVAERAGGKPRCIRDRQPRHLSLAVRTHELRLGEAAQRDRDPADERDHHRAEREGAPIHGASSSSSAAKRSASAALAAGSSSSTSRTSSASSATTAHDSS